MFFGYKSTTLESVGVLLPLLVFHERVMGRNIVIMIDNMAVVYGWPKGLVKNDKTASEVLKAAHYLSCFLGVTIQYTCPFTSLACLTPWQKSQMNCLERRTGIKGKQTEFCQVEVS